jgi:16S rRNA (guanine1207-N2)-methyltransferase
MARLEDASVDLIVCNPPFHIGTSVHTGPALKLIRAAGRVLRPGGELWTVFNTPLGYQGYLRAHVGPTEIAGRNAKFTVAVSRRG